MASNEAGARYGFLGPLERPMSTSDLKALVGRWSTASTLIYPPDAKGEVHLALDTYRYLPGGLVLVHEVESGSGRDPVNSIEIIHSADDGRVVSRNFDSRGEISDYRWDLAAGVLVIQGQTERFSGALLGHDRIEGTWELLTHRGWVDWISLRLDRIA